MKKTMILQKSLSLPTFYDRIKHFCFIGPFPILASDISFVHIFNLKDRRLEEIYRHTRCFLHHRLVVGRLWPSCRPGPGRAGSRRVGIPLGQVNVGCLTPRRYHNGYITHRPSPYYRALARAGQYKFLTLKRVAIKSLNLQSILSVRLPSSPPYFISKLFSQSK